MSDIDNVEVGKSFNAGIEHPEVSSLDEIFKERDAKKPDLDMDENPTKPPIKEKPEVKEPKVIKPIDDAEEESIKAPEKKGARKESR